MKRTGEIVLTTTGLVLSFFGTLIITTILFFSNTNLVIDTVIETAMEEGVAVNLTDIENFLNLFLGLGWIILIILIISLILAVISIYFFVGNKKPKAASIIAIIAAVMVTIGTAFTAFVPGILYLIAGIMGLVRKPPITHDPHFQEGNINWNPNNPDEFN